MYITKNTIMEIFVAFMILLASILCFVFLGYLPWIKKGADGPGKPVPEAPGSWPIIGHLHLLAAGTQVPHKLFGSMADKFGPIFTINFGAYPVLIVNNAELAKECLTTNDRVFASRPKIMATELMGYNYANFGFGPSGVYWRDMRKILVVELGSQRRLQMLARLRASEVKSSISDIYSTWTTSKGSSETVMVDLTQWFGDFNVNMIVRLLFGNSFSPGQQNEEAFKKPIREFMELNGANVPSDAIPWLRWFDLGGYEKKMKKTAQELDVVIGGWLDAHKKETDSSPQVDEAKDQVLMAALYSRVKQLKEDLYGFTTDVMVKATSLAILAAGTDTTTISLTWALALLANNPGVLKRAQQELEDHVGRDRNVEESDLKNLVYLQAIIKESMRLYPAGPLLLPHESTEDCVVSGYTVPKGTRLFINAWKIQHDPQIWSDPFEFQPERFLSSKKDVDVKGQHYELLPFGSGRRICPGISFALQAMGLILGNLIHGFDLQNPSNDPIDMTETPGIVNVKATPLKLLVSPRLSPDLYQVSA